MAGDALGGTVRKPQFLHDVEFDERGDIDAVIANLPSALSAARPEGEVMVIIPPRLIRTRRLSFTIELKRAFSNADFDEITRAAGGSTGEDEKRWASLYRLPAAFILDHQVSFDPPMGKTGDIFTAEFLDLSAKLSDLSKIEKVVRAEGYTLADVLTPHETLAHMLELPDDDVTYIHIGDRDLVVSVLDDNGLAGAGSMAAGRAHLASDLVLAGLVTENDAPALVAEMLTNPDGASEEALAILEARLEEFAGFAHHVSSAAHVTGRRQIVLSGLKENPSFAVELFSRVFDGADVSASAGRAKLLLGTPAALGRPRIIQSLTRQGELAGLPVLRWLTRHF